MTKMAKNEAGTMVKIIPRYFLSFKTNGFSDFLKEKYIPIKQIRKRIVSVVVMCFILSYLLKRFDKQLKYSQQHHFFDLNLLLLVMRAVKMELQPSQMPLII
jgi:hypothetical protein